MAALVRVIRASTAALVNLRWAGGGRRLTNRPGEADEAAAIAGNAPIIALPEARANIFNRSRRLGLVGICGARVGSERYLYGRGKKAGWRQVLENAGARIDRAGPVQRGISIDAGSYSPSVLRDNALNLKHFRGACRCAAAFSGDKFESI